MSVGVQRKILLVEDDKTLGSNLKEQLSLDYEVYWATTVKDAIKTMGDENLDLIILDIGLPDGSGLEVVQAMADRKRVRFIFLTAQSGAEMRLQGFELGAEEFIPKPFFLKELLLRVKHVLDVHPVQSTYRLKNATIDWNEFSLHKDGGGIDFPALNDMKILRLLIERSPKPIHRDEILDKVWGPEQNPNHRIVDNAIVRLRQLLGEDGQRIRSVRAAGYQWLAEDAKDE